MFNSQILQKTDFSLSRGSDINRRKNRKADKQLNPCVLPVMF